jgi:nicotinamide riboside kinase
MKTCGKFMAIVGIVALVGVAVTGCSKDAKSIASSGTTAFQSAPPETKAAWESALAAVKSDDYAAAILALQKLHGQAGLNPEQIQAVEKTATAVSDQMYAAANKGDPNAKKAIEDLRKTMSR